MFLDATEYGPHMSIFKTEVYISNQGFKDGRTDTLSTLPHTTRNNAPIDFALFSDLQSKLREQRLSDLN